MTFAALLGVVGCARATGSSTPTRRARHRLRGRAVEGGLRGGGRWRWTPANRRTSTLSPSAGGGVSGGRLAGALLRLAGRDRRRPVWTDPHVRAPSGLLLARGCDTARETCHRRPPTSTRGKSLARSRRTIRRGGHTARPSTRCAAASPQSCSFTAPARRWQRSPRRIVDHQRQLLARGLDGQDQSYICQRRPDPTACGLTGSGTREECRATEAGLAWPDEARRASAGDDTPSSSGGLGHARPISTVRGSGSARTTVTGGTRLGNAVGSGSPPDARSTRSRPTPERTPSSSALARSSRGRRWPPPAACTRRSNEGA